MLTNLDVCIRISVAFASGFLIGLERQLNNRIAGIHTNVLGVACSSLWATG
jgi:uncharacterized membrane protein YhiD involved in acid resistance